MCGLYHVVHGVHVVFSFFSFQVTYSQLALGDPIRSYNNRQSNPNIRQDIEEANERFNRAYSSQHGGRDASVESSTGVTAGNNAAHTSRRQFKSAPNSR